ncbi:TM0106 family RecB-like putative nuclease, partial [bacterium]|nr:TM0106 family RecB-like putative nuclease [bacterium]
MRSLGQQLTFAPTDLARFSDNPYVTWMDRLHLEQPGRVTPDEDPEELKIIGNLGMEHERAFLARLRAGGRSIEEIPEGDMDERARATEAALRSGVEVVYQGALASGPFAGLADFLVRVEKPSDLGDFSYEVWDTKLARNAKPYFLFQLCCYAEMLERLQGRRPARVVVVTGDSKERSFRTDDHFYYYRSVKDAFLEQQAAWNADTPPEPMREGHNGKWETEAAKWMEATDHLSRVADIRTDQILKLRAAGIDTRQALAELPADARVPRVREETLAKLRHQARLQVDSEGLDRPLYEVVHATPDDPRRGLALLPPPSPLDVAFDIEGYPLTEDGLEYLLGASILDDGTGEGTPSDDGLRFVDWWAHNDEQERASFEAFLDWTYARWKKDPTMHVYHYAAYEVTAMRRLMGKYATREREVDDLLRHEVFVDLYRVVHQGLRIGAPSYSLKKVERLYLDARTEDVATAGESIVVYQRWMENPDGGTWEDSKTLKQIRDYNEVDCISTWKLIDWLRAEQEREDVPYLPAPEPEGKRPEEAETDAERLARELLERIPEERGEGEEAERWRVHELLAWLIEFHRREEKPVWWRMFDRRDSSEDQLREDLDCLAGCVRTDREPWKVAKSMAFEYRFDSRQDTKMHVSAGKAKSVLIAQELIGASLIAMDGDTGRLELKLGPKALKRYGPGGPPARLSLLPNDYLSAATIAQSIFRIAERCRDTGELPPALADFLFRRRPRLAGGERASGSLAADGESPLDAARAVVPRLDASTLCIQG